MTAATGSVQAQYDVDPFGRTVKRQGGQDADFQFAGYYFHPASGLSLTVNRAYSANLGRWLSRDPIEDKEQDRWYQYVSNNPVSFLDPLGLTEHYLDYINCAGYGCREGHYIEPSPGQTFKDMFKERGWKCKPKKAKKCCCGDGHYTIVVYMYYNPGGGNPWTTPFNRGSSGSNLDPHVIRMEADGTWTYQPNHEPQPGTPHPLPGEPPLTDPDDYWRRGNQPVPKDAYCCCKKK